MGLRLQLHRHPKRRKSVLQKMVPVKKTVNVRSLKPFVSHSLNQLGVRQYSDFAVGKSSKSLLRCLWTEASCCEALSSFSSSNEGRFCRRGVDAHMASLPSAALQFHARGFRIGANHRQTCKRTVMRLTVVCLPVPYRDAQPKERHVLKAKR